VDSAPGARVAPRTRNSSRCRILGVSNTAPRPSSSSSSPVFVILSRSFHSYATASLARRRARGDERENVSLVASPDDAKSFRRPSSSRHEIPLSFATTKFTVIIAALSFRSRHLYYHPTYLAPAPINHEITAFILGFSRFCSITYTDAEYYLFFSRKNVASRLENRQDCLTAPSTCRGRTSRFLVQTATSQRREDTFARMNAVVGRRLSILWNFLFFSSLFTFRPLGWF